MSSGGRGRGYSGRHNRRPGDPDDEAVRTLADLSPRATDREREKEKGDVESEKEDEVTAEDEAVLKELLFIDEQYQPLLVLLEQFSPMEDGIQFNRKLRHFETTITNMCSDENRLQAAFATFRAAALLSPVTARKLAGVGASFTRQQRQQLLRTALLNVIMQGTYSKLDVLERANPMFLINAANLMGDYFAEARLCNGNKVHILASPLTNYMKALLASDDVRAHRSLATQLMQNGRELLSVLASELEELTIAIRLRVLQPPPCGVIWLLLSSDMCLNKFLPLPNSLQQFYAAHLKLTAENDSYSEVSYGSWKKSPDNDEQCEISVANVSLTSDDDTKPKLRPILGAGAGLLRQEQAISVSQDSFETWTQSNKSNLTKRYDLNSWRQEEETKEEPVYDPTVLPPNFTDFPPPNQRYNQNYPENFNNYLQQGDGTYIQNQYYQQETQYYPDRQPEKNYQDVSQNKNYPDVSQNKNYPDVSQNKNYPDVSQNKNYPDVPQNINYPDVSQNLNYQEPPQKERTVIPTDHFDQNAVQTERTVLPTERNVPDREKNTINNETQKNARKPIENWRKEKSLDLNEKKQNWTRQKSKDNINDEEQMKRRNSRETTRDSRESRDSRSHGNRRNSGEDPTGNPKENTGSSRELNKTPPRRHVSDVPRNHKYWDHDDRCDKDYNS